MSSITKKEIEEAIKNSGYLLEDRVNKILQKGKWHTIPNDRYVDSETNKEREIDILGYSMLGDFDNETDLIHSTLIIECMNNKEPIAFFENKEKFPSIIAGLNFNGFNKYFREILREAQFKMPQEKLYINSTQYCSFQRVQKLIKTNNNGWIATHPDLKHDSIDSLFKYIKFNKNSYQKIIERDKLICGAYYRPVIIVQGELLVVNQNGKELKIENTEHIKFSIPKTDNDGFIFTIDIMIEDHLEKYLKEIEIEDFYIDSQLMEKRHKLKEK